MSATLGLLDMPPDQMESIVRFMDVPTLCSMERSCKTLLALSRQDDALLWQAIVERRWGPVRIPTAWNHEHLCSWIEAAGKRSDRARQLISAQTPTTWRQLLAHLETVVAEWLLVSVKQTVELLLLQGIVSRTDKQAEEPLGTGWHAVLRQVLSWAPLDAKRRITAFVCADWHPPGTLARFLAPMVISGSTPVVALRALLLRFPFLPIDAGAGADRVIGWFSREYVARNARHLGSLGLGLVPADVAHTAPEGEQLRAEDHLLAADGIASNESTMVDDGGGDDDDDDDDSAVLDAAGTREAKMQRLAARCGLSRTEFQASRDAVYTLTYSVRRGAGLLLVQAPAHTRASSFALARRHPHAHAPPRERATGHHAQHRPAQPGDHAEDHGGGVHCLVSPLWATRADARRHPARHPREPGDAPPPDCAERRPRPYGDSVLAGEPRPREIHPAWPWRQPQRGSRPGRARFRRPRQRRYT